MAIVKRCPVNGCHEFTDGGRCEKHSTQQKKQQRVNRRDEPFYNTVLWQGVRKSYRNSNPLCEICLLKGHTKPAEMVHHIVPIIDGGDRTARSNLQSVCNACHGELHKATAGGGGVKSLQG